MQALLHVIVCDTRFRIERTDTKAFVYRETQLEAFKAVRGFVDEGALEVRLEDTEKGTVVLYHVNGEKI